MSFTADEIGSQPVIWRKAVDRGRDLDPDPFLPGRRLAVVGCGTSYHMAQAFAALREARGLGEADAIVASEWRTTRRYDAVVALSRSGTTTEVVRVLEGLDGDVPSVALSAVAGTPVVEAARDAVLLEFADERSIVQTRFATGALALWRAHLGDDLEPTVRAAERALLAPLPAGPDGLDRRARQRGRPQAARSRRRADRVVPGHGVPARPDRRRRSRHAGLGVRRAAGPPRRRAPPGG